MMRRKVITWSAVMLLLSLLQTVIKPLTWFGVGPEYVLCGVIALCIFEDEKFASVYGLVFGLFCDLALPGLFGFKGIIYMFSGYIVGRLCRDDVAHNILSMYIFTAAPFAAQEILSLMFNLKAVNVGEAFVYIVLPKLLLTAPVTAVIYFMFKWLRKLILRREGLSGSW